MGEGVVEWWSDGENWEWNMDPASPKGYGRTSCTGWLSILILIVILIVIEKMPEELWF